MGRIAFLLAVARNAGSTPANSPGFLSLLELGWQGSQQMPSARTGTFREFRFFLTVPL